jgi:hypothetical protein
MSATKHPDVESDEAPQGSDLSKHQGCSRGRWPPCRVSLCLAVALISPYIACDRSGCRGQAGCAGGEVCGSPGRDSTSGAPRRAGGPFVTCICACCALLHAWNVSIQRLQRIYNKKDVAQCTLWASFPISACLHACQVEEYMSYLDAAYVLVGFFPAEHILPALWGCHTVAAFVQDSLRVVNPG